MDEAVLRGLARWPNVPAVFGWLSLDRRGNWRIKNERIGNQGLNEFIGRNYASDSFGRWFFQNGPQRVYVRIECLPYVLSTIAGTSPPGLVTQTGLQINSVERIWLHPDGDLIASFSGGVGLICDRDLERLMEYMMDPSGRTADDACIEHAVLGGENAPDTGLSLRLASGVHRIARLPHRDLGTLFGFTPDPRPAPGQPDC